MGMKDDKTIAICYLPSYERWYNIQKGKKVDELGAVCSTYALRTYMEIFYHFWETLSFKCFPSKEEIQISRNI